MKKMIWGILFSLLIFSGSRLNASGKDEKLTSFPSSVSSLTIYTPHQSETIIDAVKEFQEQTGYQISLVMDGTGNLLNRLRSEQAKGIFSCDVFWGGGAESICANDDLFEPFLATKDYLIPTSGKDAENHFWVGESPVPVIIMYNTQLVDNANAPKSWGDLLDRKWEGKIAYTNPGESGSAYTLLCTMNLAMGGWDYLRKLKRNLMIVPTSEDVYRGVSKGEYYLGLTQEKAAFTEKQKGMNVGIIYPEEGTSAVPDALAIAKGTKNREAALTFINFIVNEPNQKMMARNFFRRPILVNLDPPQGLINLSDIKLIEYDFAWAASNRKEILDKWATL